MQESEQIYIPINGYEINSSHIQKCIDKFRDIIIDTEIKHEFIIKAEDEIKKIDFSFFGHLMLFSSEYKRKYNKDLSIKLILPKNISITSDEDESIYPTIRSMIWKIRQQMIHAYYSMSENSVFSLVDGNGEMVSAEQKKDNWFVLSKKFLPIILINKDNLNLLFNDSSNLHNVQLSNQDFLSSTSDKEESLYQAYRKLLFERKNKSNYFLILSQLAFYKSLQEAKILRFYLFDQLSDEVKLQIKMPQNRDLIQVGVKQDVDKNKGYRKVILPVFDEMKKSSPIFCLIFYTLISSDLIDFEEKDLSFIAKKIINLWEFTKELVFGLLELAKNIVQHSSEQEGIISGFINNKNEFEIRVFDHGKISVLTKLLNDTQSFIDNHPQKDVLWDFYAEDIKILKSNTFNFINLFKLNGNQILNQQTKRATAHLGLLIFSKLIEENNGQMFVSSSDFKSGRLPYLYSTNGFSENSLSVGTNYLTILPIENKEKFGPYVKFSNPNTKREPDIVSIEHLINYKLINIDKLIQIQEIDTDNIKDVLLNFYLKECLENKLENGDKLWQPIIELFPPEIVKKINDNPNIVFCFGFSQIKNLNASQLFRFIGKFEVYFPKNNLIIYDITNELFFELTKVNKALISYNKSLPYWNTDTYTVIYNYIILNENLKNEGKSEILSKFYFTDILWGESELHFRFVNSLIRKNNYNAVYTFPKEKDFKEKELDRVINNRIVELTLSLPISNLFFNQITLLPFDLLIMNDENITIFESNAKSLLQNELKINQEENENKPKTALEKITKKIEDLPGFKISDSHYRLGSKIHITDFYYAKRFFQNSFFASRFALVVTRYIIESERYNYYNEEINKNLTIIGYGIYSELLVSIIVRFLQAYHLEKRNYEIKINHNIVSDFESLKLIKNYETIYANHIIIVPIASTFTTSLKIEEFLKLKDVKKNILLPHINLLVVSDGDLNKKGDFTENDVEWKYGWRKVNNYDKIVSVKPFFDQKKDNYNEDIESIREQKYFLSLPTTWHSIYECRICFPNIGNGCYEIDCKNCNPMIQKSNECLLNEKTLIQTDKSSVTPTLIFEYPKCRIINEIDKNRVFHISDKALNYRHSIRNNDHFQYYFYDEKFYEDNYLEIVRWLKTIKNNIEIINTENILIFAPEHYSNSLFVNVVNDILFSNSAIILHYDIRNNSISDFITFYHDFVLEFDKIYFVDDTIITGNTLFKTHDYLHHIMNKSLIDKFSGCIVLINRMSFYSQWQLNCRIINSEKFFAFANLHLPTKNSSDSECQMCTDLKKLKLMFDESSLDRLKYHYSDELKKIAVYEITAEVYADIKKKENPFYDDLQNFKKIEMIHRIFDYFSEDINKRKFEESNFNDWQIDLLNKTYYAANYKNAAVQLPYYFLSPESCALLKVLVLQPFSMYLPIKERIFNWTINLLNELIEKIKHELNFEIDYYAYRDLKFLIKRAGLLKSNYLISIRFFTFILNLYKNDALEKIYNKAILDSVGVLTPYNNHIIEDIEDFQIYIVAQIKEVLYENESKNILIEKRVRNILSNKTCNKSVIQLFRMILEENGGLINSFWKTIENEIIKLKINYNNTIHFDNEAELISLIKKNNYQYNELELFLREAKEESPANNLMFRKYLELKTFLAIDDDKDNNIKTEQKNWELLKKINIVCNKLQSLVKDEKLESKTGAFLLVKYREEENDKTLKENELSNIMFLAYRSGEYSGLIENGWKDSNSYLTDYIYGVNNKSECKNEIDKTNLFLNKPKNRDYNVTIDLIEKTNNGWKSLYAETSKKINLEFLSEATNLNFLLLIRFSIKKFNENNDLVRESLGVMVFYSDINIFTINITRYLLLLRPVLSKFLKKHLKNDEFRDWYETEQKRKIEQELKIVAENLRINHENIRKVYESRFEGFNHGARRYFTFWDNLFFEENINLEHLYSISQIIKSQVDVGQLFANYLSTLNKPQDFANKDFPFKWDESDYNNFMRIIKGINSYFIKRMSYFNISVNKQENLFEFNTPSDKIKSFILELICNAIETTSDRCHIEINISKETIAVKSEGKKIDLEKYSYLQEHIKSNYPTKDNIGIGLFVINKYYEDLLNIQISINIIENKYFLVSLPIN